MSLKHQWDIRLQRFVIMPLDEIGLSGREKLASRLTDCLGARNSPERLGRSIGKHKFSIARVLHRYHCWNIVNDLIQELPIAITLLFKLPLLGDILKCGNPPAALNRLIDYAQCLPVSPFHNFSVRLSLANTLN